MLREPLLGHVRRLFAQRIVSGRSAGLGYFAVAETLSRHSGAFGSAAIWHRVAIVYTHGIEFSWGRLQKTSRTKSCGKRQNTEKS